MVAPVCGSGEPTGRRTSTQRTWRESGSIGRLPIVTKGTPRARRATKRSADTLHASEAHFRLFVEAVTDYAIFMLDPLGNVVSWNAGAERIKGYKAGEIIGQHFSVFYPPADVAARLPARALETAETEGHF